MAVPHPSDGILPSASPGRWGRTMVLFSHTPSHPTTCPPVLLPVCCLAGSPNAACIFHCLHMPSYIRRTLSLRLALAFYSRMPCSATAFIYCLETSGDLIGFLFAWWRGTRTAAARYRTWRRKTAFYARLPVLLDACRGHYVWNMRCHCLLRLLRAPPTRLGRLAVMPAQAPPRHAACLHHVYFLFCLADGADLPACIASPYFWLRCWLLRCTPSFVFVSRRFILYVPRLVALHSLLPSTENACTGGTSRALGLYMCRGGRRYHEWSIPLRLPYTFILSATVACCASTWTSTYAGRLPF